MFFAKKNRVASIFICLKGISFNNLKKKLTILYVFIFTPLYFK